jgi:hypothetical protein
MASEKQIAANRRNARNSTGPKTIAGKKRASLNALRHGLASQGLRPIEAERVEQLARQIAGDFESRTVLEFARSVAAAELELAQIRQVQADLIALALSLGSLDPLDSLSSVDKSWRSMIREQWTAGMQGVKPPPPTKNINPSASMAVVSSERMADAVRRLLPELRMIYRYEARAISRRDKAVRKFSEQTTKGGKGPRDAVSPGPGCTEAT